MAKTTRAYKKYTVRVISAPGGAIDVINGPSGTRYYYHDKGYKTLTDARRAAERWAVAQMKTDKRPGFTKPTGRRKIIKTKRGK